MQGENAPPRARGGMAAAETVSERGLAAVAAAAVVPVPAIRPLAFTLMMFPGRMSVAAGEDHGGR
jgi:hypothetical protein